MIADIQFHLKKKKLPFWTKFAKKNTSGVKKANEHCYWIQNIRISINTKFDLQQNVLIFCTKFTQKVFFSSKLKKWILPSNLAYFNYSRCQVSSETHNFDFLGDRIYQKQDRKILEYIKNSRVLILFTYHETHFKKYLKNKDILFEKFPHQFHSLITTFENSAKVTTTHFDIYVSANAISN